MHVPNAKAQIIYFARLFFATFPHFFQEYSPRLYFPPPGKSCKRLQAYVLGVLPDPNILQKVSTLLLAFMLLLVSPLIEKYEYKPTKPENGLKTALKRVRMHLPSCATLFHLKATCHKPARQKVCPTYHQLPPVCYF